MHFTWRNFEEKEPINRGELFIELERFIFPLIFITKREKDYFLNYLIDESVDRLRYVFAPISQAELRALVTSGRSIRSCLSALHPIIYDEYPDGRIVNFGSIHGTIIPDQALPGRDVFLTDVPADEISKIFEFDISGFQFVLSGGRITRGIIPFTQYSEFLTNVQKLAIEVAAKIKSENNSSKIIDFNPEFKVSVQQAASFALRVEGDEVIKKEMWGNIKNYIDIFSNSSSSEIKELLDRLPEKFVRSLFNYFSHAIDYDCEILVANESATVYLGPLIALSIKSNVDASDYNRVERLTPTGYLVGGNVVRNTFNFHDSTSFVSYRGDLSQEYIDTHSNLILDNSTLYNAVIMHKTQFKFSKFLNTYELISLTPVAPAG